VYGAITLPFGDRWSVRFFAGRITRAESQKCARKTLAVVRDVKMSDRSSRNRYSRNRLRDPKPPTFSNRAIREAGVAHLFGASSFELPASVVMPQ